MPNPWISFNIYLSDEQIASIRCASNRHRTEGAALSQAKTKNLIFILVESYMSFVSDMKIDGREVTPFLNALKNDSSVYFNSHMNSICGNFTSH